MSLLSIAYSGLNAYQRALEVTGNNIVNATTRGYSRQGISFTPGVSHRYAGSFIGSGVNVSSIYRNVDQFANTQVRSTLSAKSEYDAFYQQGLQIDKLLSQDGTSLSSSLQSFFDALGQMNRAPDDSASRGVALRQAQLLVSQFNTLQTKLDEYQANSSVQLSEAVTQINQKTQDIAALNAQLLKTPDSPELLDQRELLLTDLAGLVDISVIPQGDGTVNVALTSGDMLVSSTEQRNLAISSDSTSTKGTRIVLSNGAGFIDITDNINSGMVGGLLDYERNVLGQASRMIGQLAIGMAQKFNAQHQLGMDMNNQIGKSFFTDYNSTSLQLNRSIPSSANTGTGVLSVAISDIAQTKLSDYDLIVSDISTNEVRLINKSDGTSTVMNWSSNPPAPPAGQIVIDGMTITVDNLSNLANNDRFTLQPTQGAARDLNLQIKDIKEIALASPVKVQAPISNSGTGQIALGTVFNTANVDKQYRIDFISDTQFNIVNVTDNITTGPMAFTPNSDNTVQIPDSLNPSYSIVLSGIPKPGDQFTSEYNAGGFADNRNGLALAAYQQNKIFSGGTESVYERYANLLAQVGSQTNQAKSRADAADVLHAQALDFQESKSGVNLDEEGGNLLKFRAAYEAAGKLMEVTSQLLSDLISMMR